MRYLVAAAGTGGHVFPGLSVGEALVDLGVSRRDVMYVGGNRLEAQVYPEEGFPFLVVEIRGLKRAISLSNMTLPFVVMRAKARIEEAIEDNEITAVLGMGGYVTIPAALAARRIGVPLYVSEQNATAGLANRIATRWADRTFVSFPGTGGLEHGEWVGNPVRKAFWSFDRESLRPRALAKYGLDAGAPILGIFGGSLGAGLINDAVAAMLEDWRADPIQVVHLTGRAHHDRMSRRRGGPGVVWHREAFEDAMESFYAVSDLVVARAGGAVAELSSAECPSILVPGLFGSTGHQSGNASFFRQAGAAEVVEEFELDQLGSRVEELLFDEARLSEMSAAAARIAKPGAAKAIATAMMGIDE